MTIGSEARPRSVLNVIRTVRRRWRLRLLLRGGAIVGACALATLLAASWVLERAAFSPAALLAVRLVAYGTVVAVALRYLVRPLARRVSDQRAALYLEEHDPQIQELLVTAVALERNAPLEPLARRTVERALEACARLEDGRAVERRQLRRSGGMLGGVALITVLLTALRPAGFGHGAQALLHPLRGASESSPYSIQVEPGNVTIPRGADQRIRARLSGFDAADIELVMRSGRDSAFQRIPMSPMAGGNFEASLLAVSENTEYFVEAGGVRSAVFRIRVADLPYVKALALDYHYPAYTGLPPEHVEPAGDVAALRGTRVHVSATTTLPAAGGAIVLASGARYELRPDSLGGWTGDFPVEQRGFYHLELRTGTGQVVNGSPEYTIDVLPDRAPSVRCTKPGRDTRPTAVDEVFLEATAEDDYGVRNVELLYSVNGGAEQSVTLYQSREGLREVAAGRTLYLEELGLKPGDVVSYYARARDAAPGGKPTSSDIYFLTIRPFGRDYRQADSGPQQGGGQQGENAGELTQQQREIVAATFNLVRDSAGYTASAFREYANTIALMQDRLRQQVLTLAQRMRNRQITADTVFAQIAAILPRAAAAMDTALAQLRAAGPRPALAPEQRALQQLERAEALFRDVHPRAPRTSRATRRAPPRRAR